TVTNPLGGALYPGELNSYHPDELSMTGGNLIIRSRPVPGARRGTQPYISGRVTTQNRFEFLYGTVEVRAKLPATQGLWPAIWMLPRDRSWPPEIDVMEMLGQNPKR